MRGLKVDTGSRSPRFWSSKWPQLPKFLKLIGFDRPKCQSQVGKANIAGIFLAWDTNPAAGKSVCAARHSKYFVCNHRLTKRELFVE
jgi:hypothetical protein